LVLLPFMLSAAQWDPVIEELSKSFTVIVASGPSLGFIPTLEGRASLPTYKSMFSTLLSFMEVPNNGKLLELGCGTGALCRQAIKSRPDLAVTGADINKYLLNGAYQLAEIDDIKVNTYFNCPIISKSKYAMPGEFNLTFSDATKMPFPDDFFDAVYSVTVLEECDANQALKEIYRVVKPGGAIGVVVRAIDMPQWLDLSVDDELWRKIIIPPQLISPSGVADKSLYSRVANANFRNLVMFPYLFSATRKADPKIYDWYLRRVYQPLMDMEKVELDAAKNRASEEDGLIYSQPLHCCVGWK
jgi:ubiquinone/menaquinone biosynthesis C-methylase UbiE